MCLAIYKPADVTIDWEALAEGFRCNSDGAGFACITEGVLQVIKGLFTFDDFRAAFKPYETDQAIIHFRLATHGKKDADNCHPFRVTDELVMIHNGILDIKCDVDESKSDTWHYIHHILTPMAQRDRDFYGHPDMTFLGESAIGSNKFVFLRADGDYHIWNEDMGHWKNDVWYSNRSYEKSCLIGFQRRASTTTDSRWWRDEIADTCASDAQVFSAECDPDNSLIYDELTDRDQTVYDLLLQDGWDVATLDDLVESFGPNALYEMAERTSYDREIASNDI